MPSIGIVFAIGAAITWGVVYTFDQGILREASPFAFLFIESLITAVILLPIIIFDRPLVSSLASVDKRTWLFILASVILGILANFLIFSSIKLIGSSRASIFEIAYPFFVVMFSYIAFNTKPNGWLWLGALLIFSGAVIIIELA